MEMKRLTAAALSLLLAFLPLSGMTAGASERAVSQITTEYEDGTQDVTRYEYNEDGNRTVYDGTAPPPPPDTSTTRTESPLEAPSPSMTQPRGRSFSQRSIMRRKGMSPTRSRP